MSENKTQPSVIDPRDFLSTVQPERRREDGFSLLDLFSETTRWQPRMWGPAIIGYGRYDYTYASGRSGSFLATGFSPRKAAMSIYIMPGYQDYSAILSRLGPHRLGRACLYITRLDVVDQDVLAELIRAGLSDLARLWPVSEE